MSKPFWHRLSFIQQRAVINFKDPERPRLLGLPEGWTYSEFMEQYRQPLWCTYPNALQGMMGCWSLMNDDKKMIRSEKDCLRCDCHKDHKEVSP